jgi:hypothetical protein
MLEHLATDAEYDAARDHVREVGERIGVTLD